MSSHYHLVPVPSTRHSDLDSNDLSSTRNEEITNDDNSVPFQDSYQSINAKAPRWDASRNNNPRQEKT